MRWPRILKGLGGCGVGLVMGTIIIACDDASDYLDRGTMVAISLALALAGANVAMFGYRQTMLVFNDANDLPKPQTDRTPSDS